MVFTFLKARGVNVGNSLVEDDQVLSPLFTDNAAIICELHVRDMCISVFLCVG